MNFNHLILFLLVLGLGLGLVFFILYVYVEAFILTFWESFILFPSTIVLILFLFCLLKIHFQYH